MFFRRCVGGDGVCKYLVVFPRGRHEVSFASLQRALRAARLRNGSWNFLSMVLSMCVPSSVPREPEGNRDISKVRPLVVATIEEVSACQTFFNLVNNCRVQGDWSNGNSSKKACSSTRAEVHKTPRFSLFLTKAKQAISDTHKPHMAK